MCRNSFSILEKPQPNSIHLKSLWVRTEPHRGHESLVDLAWLRFSLSMCSRFCRICCEYLRIIGNGISFDGRIRPCDKVLDSPSMHHAQSNKTNKFAAKIVLTSQFYMNVATMRWPIEMRNEKLKNDAEVRPSRLTWMNVMFAIWLYQ